MPLTTQQERDWKRWRQRYGTDEAAGMAICPDYLHGLNDLKDKLRACYDQRVSEGLKAANPMAGLKETK